MKITNTNIDINVVYELIYNKNKKIDWFKILTICQKLNIDLDNSINYARSNEHNNIGIIKTIIAEIADKYCEINDFDILQNNRSTKHNIIYCNDNKLYFQTKNHSVLKIERGTNIIETKDIDNKSLNLLFPLFTADKGDKTIKISYNVLKKIYLYERLTQILCFDCCKYFAIGSTNDKYILLSLDQIREVLEVSKLNNIDQITLHYKYIESGYGRITLLDNLIQFVSLATIKYDTPIEFKVIPTQI